MDLLIRGAQVVTMDPRRSIYDRADVFIHDGKIQRISPAAAVRSAAGAPSPDAVADVRVVEADGDILFPGLINTHTHLFQVLLKGLGSRWRLEDWWPRTVKPATLSMGHEDTRYAALAGCAEALLSGTTTVVDFMYANRRAEFSDVVMDAMAEVGVRSIFARGFRDTGADRGFPPELIEQPVHVFKEVERLKTRAAQLPRTKVWIAPTALWSMTRQGLQETREYARATGTRITMHTFETGTDDAVTMTQYGMHAIDLLEETGLLGPDLLAVHCVKCDDRTLDALRRYDVAVSHNPTCNMYIASGAARIRAMLDRGIRVGLGTDGPASNNNMNMVESMKMAALLQRVTLEDAAALSGQEALEMATIGAARALGMEQYVGSIEPGKCADLLLLSRNHPSTSPVHDPVASLVFSASFSSVRHVFVDGEPLVWEGNVTRVDVRHVMDRLNVLAQHLAQRAGI